MHTIASVILIGALVAAAPRSQLPPRWSDLPVPGGVAVSQLTSQGKLVTYREGGTLWCFSSFTRRWHALNVPPSTPVRHCNDCLLVQGPSTWTAFSAYTGQTATLAVSAAARLLNPGSQRNDSVFLVEDSGVLHAFSCFVGSWVDRPLPAAYDATVQRHVAVLAMGNTLGGFDAYEGQWTDLAVSSSTWTLSCDGMAGFAATATEVHAFSAVHRTWSTATIPIGATFVRDDDWGMFYDAVQMVAYSAIQGRFATAPYGASTVPYATDLLAIADTPIGLVAYSAPRAQFSLPLGPATAGVTTGIATAVLRDGLQVTGYSAVLDAATTITIDCSYAAASAVVAAAVDNGTGAAWCYSALTGTWNVAPPNAQPGPPVLTTTCALLAASPGAYAFSARSGIFVPLATNSPNLAGNDQSAIGAVWDATTIHAFDARAEAWRAVPRTSTAAPVIQIWRTSMLAIDGQTAHGFGAQCSTWQSRALPEPYVTGGTGSENGRVLTANHLLCHSPVPLLLAHGQFPEFRRIQPTGTTADFSLHLPGGGAAVLAGGFLAATPTPVPGFGALWLQQPLATVLVQATPPDERASFALAVPATQALVGLQLAFQALAIPNSGSPGLTDAATLTLL